VVSQGFVSDTRGTTARQPSVAAAPALRARGYEDRQQQEGPVGEGPAHARDLADIHGTFRIGRLPRPTRVCRVRFLAGPGSPYPCRVSVQATPERDIVSWEDLDRLVADLAGRLAGTSFDVMLCITRGGLVPAGMLASPLRIRNILVAAVAFYDDEGQPGPHPTFLQFLADPLLRGQRVLIVDEVWESGTTIHAATQRLVPAGGS